MADTKIPKETSAIVVPNCKVCTHPRRNEIEEMLMLGTSYKGILETLGEDADNLSAKSLSNHKRKHISPNIIPEIIPASVQAGIIDTRNRIDNLQYENQRLRAEAFMADQKLRMTQQASVCMVIIDQLPNILETATVKDVLAANKQLSEIMGDRVERKEVQIDIIGELGMDKGSLKEIGDIVAKNTKKAIRENVEH